jgi:pullulanase/glycogen debranching enzyme
LTRQLIALRGGLPWLQHDKWPGANLQIRWLRDDGEEMTMNDWSQPRAHLVLAGSRDGSSALLLLNAGDAPALVRPPVADAGPWQVLVNTACGRGEGTLVPPYGFALDACSVALLMTAGGEGAS